MEKKQSKFMIIMVLCLSVLLLPLTFGCDTVTGDSMGLVINEVVSSNSSSLIDQSYGSPDWIELYNDSSNSIDLGNYLITDNAQNEDKTFLLPKITLEPHGYQIIYASKIFESDSLGLANVTDDGIICVNFGLNKAGDTVTIADDGYNLVQELVLPALDKDISYARKSDGSYGYCANATPNKPNTTEIFSTLDLAVSSINTAPNIGVTNDLIINEVVAKNVESLPHSDCADCDWIELYNNSDETLMLDGFSLSDKEYELGKANLDGLSIPAKGYLLVCCCEDQCVSTDGHYCVKMGISRYGETVFIYDSFGRTVVSLDVPLLEADVSYARRDDGSYGVCKVPTPNAQNTSAIVDTLAPQNMDSSDAVRINEVLPVNKYSIIDRDGDRSDWVELYNSGNEAMSLLGCYLSDDGEDLLKWELPDVTIEPKGYLIVFLSGKDSDENELHATFSLGRDDTEILFYNSNVDRVDRIELVPVDDNVSIGRAADGTAVFYRQPTPYAPNAFAYTQADAIGFFQTDGLYISEVCSSHAKGTGDNDWIELCNGSANAINVNGYYLSDDPDNLTMWQIGDIEIDAGSFAVVETTSHQTRVKDGIAPFGISPSGETLFLSNPQGTLIDYFSTGVVRLGMTSGRINGNSSVNRVFFDVPTRGKANSNSIYIGYTSQPVFSETGLYQNTAFDLEISCSNPDAVIYYTTNGSEPTSKSAVYTGAINISDSMVVRATACVDGLVDSPITTYHYLFEEPHTVPVVCVAMDWDEFKKVYSVKNHSDKVEKEAYLSYYERDGSLGIMFPAGLKAKGRGTLIYAQKSLAIHLRGCYGQSSVSYPFFDDIPFTEFSSLVLRNGGQDHDNARIRDSYLSRVVQGLNIETAATRPVVMYVNGEYYGLYDFNEDLNADYLATHYGADQDMVDIVRRNSDATHGSSADFLRVRKFAVNNNLGRDELYEEFCQWVDADYFIDYVIVQSYTANYDMFNQKYWRTSDYSIKWRPIYYDLDTALPSSTANMMHQYFTEAGIPSANGSLSNMDIYCGLVENQSWRDRFVERYVEIVVKYFNSDRMVSILDEMVAEMEPEMERSIARWGIPKSYDYWMGQIDKLRTIVSKRPTNALNHMKKYFGVSDSLIEEYIQKYS